MVDSGGLFRFSSAARHDPAIDAWISTQDQDLGSMALVWFTRMRQCGPDIRELMHDGCPVACVGEVAFGYVNVFTAHVNVGFFHGAHLDDPGGLLEGAGKRMRHVKLRRGVECDPTALGYLIDDAYADVKRRMEGAAGDTPCARTTKGTVV